jgi:small-conductance mechanosensitive channel
MQDWIADTLDVSGAVAGRLLATAIALVVVFVVRWILVWAASRRIDDTEAIFRARKTATYGATLVLLVVSARIWSESIDNVGTFLGLVSAGLAIALAPVFLNLAGWVYIVARRPFRAGDRVEIGDHAGDVVDIRILRFTILEINNWVDADQSTGRLIHLPNALLFEKPMANYTEGFNHIWHEIPVLVTFESDWRRAEEIVRRTLAAHHMSDEQMHAAMDFEDASRRYLIRPGELEPTVFIDVKDSGVLVTGRLLVHPHERRAIADAVWRDILDAFAADPAVDFAYYTIRTYPGPHLGN